MTSGLFVAANCFQCDYPLRLLIKRGNLTPLKTPWNQHWSFVVFLTSKPSICTWTAESWHVESFSSGKQTKYTDALMCVPNKMLSRMRIYLPLITLCFMMQIKPICYFKRKGKVPWHVSLVNSKQISTGFYGAFDTSQYIFKCIIPKIFEIC